MFRIENWKQALGLMALGSVFTIIGLSLSPVTAQREKFGDIECNRLTVVDADGTPRVILSGRAWDSSTPFGSEDLKHGGVFIGRVGLYSGVVDVYGDWSHPMEILQSEGFPLLDSKNKGKGRVRLVVDEVGGRVGVNDENGKSAAAIGIDKNGGYVGVSGQDGKSAAELAISEHGGCVATWDKNGYRQ